VQRKIPCWDKILCDSFFFKILFLEYTILDSYQDYHYEIRINGNQLYSVNNTAPGKYENVSVFASNNYPIYTHGNAKIRSLQIWTFPDDAGNCQSGINTCSCQDGFDKQEISAGLDGAFTCAKELVNMQNNLIQQFPKMYKNWFVELEVKPTTTVTPLGSDGHVAKWENIIHVGVDGQS